MASSIGAGLMLEQPRDNPFLERFYRSPTRYALQTQLFFLFQRVKQLKEVRQGDLFSPIRIADFMLEKDPLFARLTLDEDEIYLYEQVYTQLAMEVPKPDLVIYLQAPTEVLIRRIRKRGVLLERNMERDYLEQLADAYTRFFLSYHDSPLLMVNAENINILDNEEHFNLLLEQVKSIGSGRHYFNPVL
jgi:deoxyguanosine kinase